MNLAGSNGFVLNALLESTIITSRFAAMPPKIIIDGNILSSNILNLTFKNDIFRSQKMLIKMLNLNNNYVVDYTINKKNL